MLTHSIAIVNASTVLTDAAITAALPALQTQITRDFAPIWGMSAVLALVTPGAIPASSWSMVLYDDADQPGALGYHEDLRNRPDGKVFARTTIDAGLSWTVTLAHELLEMLADPYCTRYRSHVPYRYALEVGDPVEDDRYGYTIDGVLVSDFITPSWFGSAKAGSKYDLMGHLVGPRQLLPGGYCSRWAPLQGWRQIFATNGTVQARKQGAVYSRPGTSGRVRRRMAG